MAADGKTILAYTESGDLIEVFPIEVSGGAVDAGRVAVLGPDGRWSSSVMPLTSEASDPIVTTEALTAYSLVHVYNISSDRRIKKAIGADNTSRCHGYVRSGYQNGDSCEVYYKGELVLPIGSFVVDDTNAPVFLSATVAGGLTKTPPNGPGNFAQVVGFIRLVDTAQSQVVIVFDPEERGVIRGTPI